MKRFAITSLLPGVLVCFSMLGAPAAHAAVFRVRSAAPGPVADGASWGTAFPTVQAGLNAATAGDEVWVAEGTYREAVVLPSDVGLYGGFEGTEATRDQRNAALHTTALELDRNGAAVTSVNGGSRTVLDGFTLRCPIAISSAIIGVSCQTSSLTISNNIIVGFSTYQLGGGIACHGGTPQIRNNRIIGNRAAYGGGIYCSGSNATIANNVFIGDVAPGLGFGGGVYCNGSTSISNNVFVGNTAGQIGGGLYSQQNSGRIVNNTFVANRAPEGGGMAFGQMSAPLLANNIVAFNSSGVQRDRGINVAPTFRSNCLYENGAYDVSGFPNPVGVNGNIAVDPLLAGRASGNVHIQPGSPCVDAGSSGSVLSSDLDMDGQPRIQGPAVDIGADESDGSAWPAMRPVVRVSPGGDDAADGASWATAKRTVGAALRAVSAASGGEVWVQTGVYNERVTLPLFTRLYGGFSGAETERGERDPTANQTVLDGGRGGTVVTILPGATADTELDGFTIRDGSGTGSSTTSGGGIVSINASPVIRNNIVERNVAYRGSGIYCQDGDPLIDHNTFRENQGPEYYGAVALMGYGAPVVSNNEVTLNAGTGLYLSMSGSRQRVSDNTVTRNAGSGIRCVADADIVSNTIAGNGADKEAGGIAIWGNAPSTQVANNIIAFNASGVFTGTPAEGVSDSRTFRNNCVYGNLAYDYRTMADPTGTDGNIAADPMFARLGIGDIHIQPDSPCRDAGDDGSVVAGARDVDGQARVQGARVDIGADESDGTAWPAPPERTVRVRPDGSDANDGSSWTLAKRTVQAAINAVAAGGGAGEVWLAAGTYLERIILGPDVAVYGGFKGNETAKDERDWRANVTTLDGGHTASVVTIPAGCGLTTVVDGLTIVNGRSTFITDADGVARGYGGGILCRGALPVIRHNAITGNSGVAGVDGAGLIADNAIDGNLYGGIHLMGGAVLRNTITRNGGQAGAGISCSTGSPLIAGNIISENGADMKIGTGGGIYAVNGAAIILNNAIFGNSAYRGGGLYCDVATPVVANNAIWGNTASRGSAMIAGYGDSLIVNNTMTDNTSTDPQGAAVYFQGTRGTPAPPTIFANNIVAFNASGIQPPFVGAVDFRANCVFDNADGNYLPVDGFVDPTGTNGNISVDPMLEAAPDDLRLRAGSPCIDAGDDSVLVDGWTDLDGAARIVGAAVDIGAYEYAGAPYALQDVVRALRVTAGISAADAMDMARLDVETGASPGVDILDAARLARKAAGLDAGD
jgi:hypothetical protein